MGFFTSNKEDLSVATKLDLNWPEPQAEASLNQLFHHATGLANDSIKWYLQEKKAKKTGARFIRIASIVLATAAAIFPAIIELSENPDGTPKFGAGWTTVFLGVAGALLLLDRFFGYSSAWMRYIVAELHLRQANQEFQLDWKIERSGWQGEPPSKEQVSQMLARCKAFVSQVNNIIREETNIWVQEFQDTIKYLDESIKAKPALTELGALNLTIDNEEVATEGWELTINGGKSELYKGSTAGKQNMIPGKHLVKVTAKAGGKTFQAEKVVTVPVGGICNETLTLV